MAFLAKSDVIKIATVTLLVFVITNFMKVSTLISGSKDTQVFDMMHNALAIPGNFKLWLHQPWSIITFMFSAEGFVSLLFDFIWLWIFGSVIEDLKGMYRILPIYLVGGIFGGLAYMTIGQLGSNSGISTWYYLGVLPSVIAVVTATVGYKPTYAYWFYSVRIPIWVLAIVFYILKIGTLSNYSVQSIALLFGGVAAGLLYNYGGIAIYDQLTVWFKRIAYAGSNENFVEKKAKPYRSPSSSIPTSTIDEILDKINQKGIQSLTSAEKKLLESYSKEK